MIFHSFWFSNISVLHKLFTGCLEVQLKMANLCYECMFLTAVLMNWFPCRVMETVLQSNEWKSLNFKYLFTKNNATFYTKFWRIRKLSKWSDPVLLYVALDAWVTPFWKMKQNINSFACKCKGKRVWGLTSGNIDTSVISFVLMLRSSGCWFYFELCCYSGCS